LHADLEENSIDNDENEINTERKINGNNILVNSSTKDNKPKGK